MSEIRLTLDVPKRTMGVARTALWSDFKEEVKTRYLIDLNHYHVETLSNSITSPVRSQQEFDRVITREDLAFQAKLQIHAKPTCLVCRKSFSNKPTYESHFKDCPPANSHRPAGGTGLQGFLVQRKSAGLQSLITAL